MSRGAGSRSPRCARAATLEIRLFAKTFALELP